MKKIDAIQVMGKPLDSENKEKVINQTCPSIYGLKGDSRTCKGFCNTCWNEEAENEED